MGLRHAKFRGKIKIRGTPKQQAKAEIILMKAQEERESRKNRRILFTLLDFIIVIAFVLAIYSIYVTSYINALLFAIVGAIPLAYFIIRRILKIKSKNINK